MVHMCYLTWLSFFGMNSPLAPECCISPLGLSESREHLSTSRLDASLSGWGLIYLKISVLLLSALESLNSIQVSAVKVQFWYPTSCISYFIFSLRSAFLSLSLHLLCIFIWYGCVMKRCGFSNAMLSLTSNAASKCDGKTLFFSKI